MKRETGQWVRGCVAVAAAVLVGAGVCAEAGPVFSTDFAKGTFNGLGWEAKGDWAFVNYGDKKAGLANNPGRVVRFAANGEATGTLTKKFFAVSNPSHLVLTFEAGYGWGAKDHSQGFQVWLLDAQGNGYAFGVARANATWGAQWAPVTKYSVKDPMNWAPAAIDTTQAAVVDGGGLRAFTVTRDAGGKWSFAGAGWGGGPLTFTDDTTRVFSQVVLRGSPNFDELVFGRVKLETGAPR